MPTRTTGIFRPLPNPSSPDKKPQKKGGKIRAEQRDRAGEEGAERARERKREREKRLVWGHSCWSARDLVGKARERRGRKGRAKLRELIV
jgi:hypothetical protein